MSAQPVPEFGGCPWPLDPACLSDTWEDYPPEVRARAGALASATLERLTAFRVRNCPVKVRPCSQRGAVAVLPQYLGYGAGSFYPGIDLMGRWVNTGACTDCEGTACEVPLPGPIGRIDEIMVDGAEVSLTNVRISGNRVVWVGAGACPFPASQDTSKPDTEEGTFSITYLNAYPPDAVAAYAAGTLALQYAKACVGSKCDLPSSVRSIVRQGVTMEVITGAFPDGFTGIKTVDSFISLWNPYGSKRQQQTGVWFPGINAPRRG